MIVADDISGTDRARVAIDVSGRYKTRVSRVRRISRFNFAIERATSRESDTILDRTRESHIGSAHFTSARTLDRERDEMRRMLTDEVVSRDEDETHAAPRVSLVVVVVSETAVRGWSYPATQRRGKPQVIASVHSRHAREVGRTRWEFLRARCVILIVTEGGEGRIVRFSCFLTRAPRICITMFRYGRARECLQTSFLFLFFAHICYKYSSSLSFLEQEKEIERDKNSRII